MLKGTKPRNRLIKPIEDLTGCDLRAKPESLYLEFPVQVTDDNVYDNLPVADEGIEKDLITWVCEWCGCECAGAKLIGEGMRFCSTLCLSHHRKTLDYKTDRFIRENYSHC